MNRLYLMTLICFGFTVSACGGAQNVVSLPTAHLHTIHEIAIAPIEVTSKEQNPEAIEFNTQLSAIASTELQTMLTSKQIALTPNAHDTIVCRISIVYGNRALRYWVGFGAGAGKINITLELADENSKIYYTTESEDDLAMGAFGGDMKSVARHAIFLAIHRFGRSF